MRISPSQGAAILLLVFMGYVGFRAHSGDPSARWIASAKAQIASDAVMQSQRIAKLAPSVIRGNMGGLDPLQASQKQLTQDMALLTAGGPYRGRTIPGASSSEDALIGNANIMGARSTQAAASIFAHRSSLVEWHGALKKMNALYPNLLDASMQLPVLYATGAARPVEVVAAFQLEMLTVRLARNANAFLILDNSDDPETAFLLSKDIKTFAAFNDGLLNGSAELRLPSAQNADLRAKLVALQASFAGYQQPVKTILDDLKNLVALKQAERLIAADNEVLKDRLSALQEFYQKAVDESL